MVDKKDSINYMKSIPVFFFALGVVLFGLHYFANLPYLDVFSTLSLAIFIIFGFAYFFIYIQRKTIKDFSNTDILGIICESDWYPSLSRAQFLSWTFIIGIIFVWLLLLKVWFAIKDSKELNISTLAISTNLLLLMGITSLTTVTSKGLSSLKYKEEKKKPEELQPLGTMLQEDGKPSLTRYQIFFWTAISILTYFGLVFWAIFFNYNNILNGLTLPDFPQILLALMGISQATYLGGKIAYQPSESSISDITKNRKIGETMDILGQNFGDEGGSVYFDDKIVNISKGDEWTNSRITVTIPTDIKPQDGKIKVKVRSKSGSTTVPVEYKICTVDWKNPDDITYGTALSSSQLNASASMPGTFDYTPPAGTVLNVGIQTLQVAFAPTDTENCISASHTVTINVLQATPTIDWNDPEDITYGTDLSRTLNAVASYNGNTIPGTYTYTRDEGGVPISKETILDAGTYRLHVDFAPTDSNYKAMSKDVQINVRQAAPLHLY
jgi:hypothetical protein